MSRIALMFLWLCSIVSPLHAATPQQYDRALGQVQAALIRQDQALLADEISPGPPPSLVAQQALGPIHAVGMPGHAPQQVNTSPLLAAIQAAEAQKDSKAKSEALEAVTQQISLLRQAITAVRGETDPAAMTASVRAVLARPEFAADPPPPLSVADRLAAWLDRVFRPRALPNVNAPNINPHLILGILIVIAAAAFAILVAGLVQAIGRRGVKARPLAFDEEEATLMEARDGDSLLARAERYAQAGDYRRAFRLVYLASLLALDTGGVLRFDRSRTNWEYLRALRAAGRSDVYTALTPLTREFDSVWYGFAPTDAAQYRRALAQYEALLAAPTGAATV